MDSSVSDSNPTGIINNSELELAGILATRDVAARESDVFELTTATGTDNIPALAWSSKGAVSAKGPAAYLLRLQSMHQRVFHYQSRGFYIPGDANGMADDCSRLWHLSDEELVPYFNTQVLIEEKKASIKDDNKRKIWDFGASPHEEFGKSLDDTYLAFLKWARLKQDTTKVNVSKALRRLESYAEWMESASSDLTEPPLSSSSIKSCLDVWGMNSTIDSEGRFLWWIGENIVRIIISPTRVRVWSDSKTLIWHYRSRKHRHTESEE